MTPETKSVKTDICNHDDVRTMVDRFYDKVKVDPLLGPVFSHVNWPSHLPTMYNFWSSLLLGDHSYHGHPLQRHLHLAIDGTHFTRWLELFTKTVDENFEGAVAAEAKMRGHAIAGIFQLKMGIK